MSKITYANKEAINVDPSIPNKNKVTAEDFNEIKKVVNENEDHQIVIIKDIFDTLPATTGYAEGDNVYIISANDNTIYTLTGGAWVSAGAPNINKYYLLINNMTNNLYYNDYYWKYTKGLYLVDDSGRLGKKIEDFSNVLSDYADFEELSSGTYLMYDLNNNGCSVLYPTRKNKKGTVNCPSFSMVSIYKQDETTVSVGDCFLLRSADNKIILGNVTNVTTNVKTWSIKYYYNALQVRKSTDASPVNMYQIFKDYTGSPTQTPLWILDDTFTLNYTDFVTQEAKTFTFDKGDMVQGNSKECVDGVPMIIYKINGERYKITNLTVVGTTYLITKLDEEILLWTNPNPTSSFGTQDININLSTYEYIEVIFRDISDDTLYQSSGKVYVGSGAKTINHTWLSGLGEVLLFRVFRTTTSKVNFENCFAVKLVDGTIPSAQNTCMIPYKIIGFK